MNRIGTVLLAASSALTFALLYAPVAVTVLFSFNAPRGRFNLLWQGFTLANWRHPLGDPALTEAFLTSLALALAAALLAGDIGDLHQVIITSRDPALPPRAYLEAAGGLFRDMTIHDFDLARFMLGEEPTEVFALGNALIDPGLGAELNEVDSAMFILRTASGRQAIITNSRRAAYGYDQRIEVLGSKGMVAAQNHGENRITLADGAGFHDAPLLNFFMTRYVAAYANEIAAFIATVQDGKPTPTTGHDGLMALALAEAALKSVAEGRAVKVSEILG